MVNFPRPDTNYPCGKYVKRTRHYCWEWLDRRNSEGYGLFELNGEDHLAHRVAYFMATGEQPGDREVIQTCQNHGCCNPAHLRLGEPNSAQPT